MDTRIFFNLLVLFLILFLLKKKLFVKLRQTVRAL